MGIDFKMARLKRKIDQYQKVVIYGAGYMAEQLSEKLRKFGISADYCVVSSKPDNSNVFENIPLYAFDECVEDMQKEDVVTLIAVTALYEKEIEDILVQHKVANYLMVTEYIGKLASIESYHNKSEQECLNEVIDWYVDTNKLTVDDIEITRKWFEDSLQGGNCFEDKILFAVGNISPRVIKIAGALRSKGYRVEAVLFPRTRYNQIFLNILKEISDSFHICDTIEELMYHIIVSKAKAVHLFSSIWAMTIPYILIRNKKIFPKLVFEQYDIANEMYVESFFAEAQEKFKNERYCLEHADGVCCRGYEQEYLVKDVHYKIEGRVIKFFDYCQDEFIDVKERCGNKGSLSLCYAGGIATEQEWPNAPYACFLEFAEICARNKCHFHVYPSVWIESKFAEYIKLDSESEYFHFHQPVEYGKLKQELSQYDYGVHLIKRGYLDKKITGYTTRNKTIYSITNHFYDYLDAGLPIIAATPVKFAEFFEKEKVLLNWTIEEYDFEQLKRRREELHRNVVSVREKLRISNKINKLTEFYNLL